MASETFHPTAHGDPPTRPTQAHTEPNGEARPRRRLGNWQTAAGSEPFGHGRETEPDTPEPHESPPSVVAWPRSAEKPLLQTVALEVANPAGSAVDAVAFERLLERVEANPQDIGALSELADHLHRTGMTREAADIHRRLAALRATPASSVRPDRPLPASFSVESSMAARVTRSRRTTKMLNRATTELFASLLSFPIDELGFTDPLPDQDTLPDDARLFVEQSGDELASGQIMAALDSCLLAIDLAPDYLPTHIRIAEIYARQCSARRARAHALAAVRLAEISGRRGELWMARRVLLHVSESGLDALKELTHSLIEAEQIDHANRYARTLIDAYVQLELRDEAMEIADRLVDLAPDNAQATLAKAALLAHFGDSALAIEHWKIAVSAGADEVIAKASIAAMISADYERDHWALLGEAIHASRSNGVHAVAEAYQRTARALPASPMHAAGEAVLAALNKEPEALARLQAAMSDPEGTNASRAFAAVATSRQAEDAERVAALRVAIQSLRTPSQLTDEVWKALIGAAPKLGDLEAELGAALLAKGEAAEAVAELLSAHTRDPKNTSTSQMLADAHVQTGQVGAALAVLDELVISLRAAGRLEAMVETLRKMSALAPDNIKVKSRLIDSYLQRGFVDDARAELSTRASLEERLGRTSDAVTSLQRSADLSWSLGKHEESFAAYQRVIALAPDDAGSRSSLVNLYLQLGRIADAAEQQRAVVDISTRLGSPHEAIAALHQVIGLTPDDGSAYHQLGELLQSMGEHQQAEKVYKRLVMMNPDDYIALEKLAGIAALRQPDQAKLSSPLR